MLYVQAQRLALELPGPENRGRGGVARLPESRPKQLPAVCVFRASILRQFLGGLKLPNTWVKLAVTYSRRIELRREKGEDTGKRERKQKVFPVFPLEKQ